ncbi:MAG: 23S rRNA (guanosine(2251)-2'-O)-methyltransferase RlmB [Solirubrobacteraceae bacterium]
MYGRNPVREALRGRRAVHRVLATSQASREAWLRGVAVRVVPSSEELERLSGSREHQGICAECEPYPYVEPESLLAGRAPTIVALDELQDPQNLGAICRTAECAGAGGVVICERRAAGVTPAVCKASAGAVEHLPIARVRNLVEFLALAKARGCWCYGAAAEAGDDYGSLDYSGGGVVLVLGAEGRGLRRLVAERCDALVAVPLEGQIGSLNVGAAAAVLLYEVLRQKKVA